MHDEFKSCVLKRIHALQEGYRQNIGLIGPEGMGKSAFMGSLFRDLCGQPSLIPVFVYVPSLDFSSLIEKWTAGILRGVFHSQSIQPPTAFDSLLKAADPIIPSTVAKIRQIRRNMIREKPHAVARELFALTGILAEETHKKCVLVLEEFESLDVLMGYDPFSALGKEIMMQKNTLFLFMGSHGEKAREIIQEKLSLLFSNFEVFEMQPLSSDESHSWLKEHGALGLHPVLKKFLIAMAGGRPLYLNLILDQIRKLKAGAGDLAAVPGVEPEEPQGQSVLFQALSKEIFAPYGRISLLMEKKIVSALAGVREKLLTTKVLIGISRGKRKTGDIAEYAERKVSEVKKVLQKLSEEMILSKVGSFYFFKDPLFQFWVRQVLTLRKETLLPEAHHEEPRFYEHLLRIYQEFRASDQMTHENRLEQLLRFFRNEAVDVDGKRTPLPLFSDLSTIYLSEGGCGLVGRVKNVRWAFKICEKLEEKDVTSFLLMLKEQNKPFQKKILIVLDQMEQNAKLLAQELKIQIWDLTLLNFLFEVYGLPKYIRLPHEEIHEASLGTLAQTIYSA